MDANPDRNEDDRVSNLVYGWQSCLGLPDCLQPVLAARTEGFPAAMREALGVEFIPEHKKPQICS
jgi:hypothetical protein